LIFFFILFSEEMGVKTTLICEIVLKKAKSSSYRKTLNERSGVKPLNLMKKGERVLSEE